MSLIKRILIITSPLWIFGAIFFALSRGSVYIAAADILLFIKEGIRGELPDSGLATIIFDIRLPRILLAFIVGGALSISGVMLQGMFRNPLVEPYTLGISGGAGLSVAVCTVMGVSYGLSMPIVGFLGACVSVLIVYSAGRRFTHLKIAGFLLVGVMVSFICSSLIMLIMSVAGSDEAHGILFWLMGNLSNANMQSIKIVSFIIFSCSLLAVLNAWKLNALSLGDDEAANLGLNVGRTRRNIFILTSLMTGTAVSMSGIIGFVGLLVPHGVRALTGHDHRDLLPLSFFMGGVFLVLCDTFARTIIAPVELPVGVITGILGGTVFLFILVTKSLKTGQI